MEENNSKQEIENKENSNQEIETKDNSDLEIDTDSDLKEKENSNETEKEIDLNLFKEDTVLIELDQCFKRRREIAEIINQIGLENTRKLSRQLAEKYNVTRTMIYYDIDYIKKHYKITNLKEVMINLHIAREVSINETLKEIPNLKGKDKFLAINTLLSAIKTYTDELEKWGIKERIPEKTDINVQTNIYQRIEDYLTKQISKGKIIEEEAIYDEQETKESSEKEKEIKEKKE